VSPSHIVVRGILAEMIAGSVCFFGVAAIALVCNYAGVRTLLLGDPAAAAIVFFGAVTMIAPIVIGVAIGAARQGTQVVASWSDERDLPPRQR
jgi:hypothetical protein